jgi:predicted acyl esterase
VRADSDSPRVVSAFPRPVRLIENVWIPLSDGCRLAARIWLPEDAERNPVPALLEYIPYRKSDWTAVGDSTRHGYFAGHGYASIRVDIRGSGDSDGVLLGKYLEQEQDDALEVLKWIGEQSWSTGACGMFGISWGGYSSLQVAMRRPSELKAVISVCASDDRYADDVQYVGGALLALHAISWPTMMLAFNARPPDPEVVGEGWRRIWLERLERSTPFVEAGLSHQWRDGFWKQGSVGEDYSAIECPVYAVGGWADCFRNGLLRLLEGLPGPKKGLMGPWGHQYPEEGVPGPRIGFLQEALRWWDYWLKGIENGIMDEPQLCIWMQDSVEPRTSYGTRPGRWVAEPSWPSPNVEVEPRPLDFPTGPISSSSVVGLEAGCWCGFGVEGDFAPDQRREDALSLCSTSDPLEEPLEILGFPRVALTLTVDQPQALVAVRLCDVHPSGASLLVTRGILNLAHRDSHETPSPLEKNSRIHVRIQLSSIAHVFPAGHRLRVGVSPIYWPWAWPSPELVTLTVSAGRLDLPLRRPRTSLGESTRFSAPEVAPALAHETSRRSSSRRFERRELATGRHVLFWDHDLNRGVRRALQNGLEFETNGSDTYSIVEGKPLSPIARSRWALRLARDDWLIRLVSRGTLSSSADEFRAATSLEAYEGAEQVFRRSWRFKIPRNHV